MTERMRVPKEEEGVGCEHCGYEHPAGGEALWHRRDNGELILMCSEPQSIAEQSSR